MPRPRKSLAQARVSGALSKNAQRYFGCNEPQVDEPLGEPPVYLKSAEVKAWEELRLRLPWLSKSHRGIAHIASCLQARLAAGTLGVPGMNLLRITLGQMGATPATSCFAIVADLPDEDAASMYFT